MRLLRWHETHKRRKAKPKHVKKFIREAKSGPCLDCGRTYPPHVMDFDHVPGRGEKLFCVSKSGPDREIRAVSLEIAKCDLVCANCHRLRTEARRHMPRAAVVPMRGPGFSVSTAPRLVTRKGVSA